jgi:anti-anti-sigma factor
MCWHFALRLGKIEALTAAFAATSALHFPARYTNMTLPTSTSVVFRREWRETTLILHAAGPLGSLHENEIDREMAELISLLNGKGPFAVVIDLAHSDYLGTALLGALVKLWKRISQQKGNMAMCNVSDQVYQVLRITKLHAVWPICYTREDALIRIAAGQPPNLPR